MEQMVRGSSVNISSFERWASVLGGISLLMIRRGPAWPRVLVGADLIRRGLTGQCYLYKTLGVRTADRDEHIAIPYREGIRVDESVIIDKSPQELYQFWRNLENLPQFMKHLVSVTELDQNRSRWTAKGPGGRRVEWEAEIINDIPGEVIGWKSVDGSDVDNAGSVQFKKLPGGRGTMLMVELQYIPPGGMLAALSAKLFGEEPQQQIREDLRRLKQLLEAGEVPVTQAETEETFRTPRRQPERALGDNSHEAAAGF